MLLSCIDEWSVPALHSISSDLDAELRTIDLLAAEIEAIGALPGWHSSAADNARSRMQSAKGALLDDAVVLRTVDALAAETARQLTEIKHALGDLRADVASYGGDLQLSDSGEVTVLAATDHTGRLHAAAQLLEGRAKALIAKADALDADCGEVLGFLGGAAGTNVQADWPFNRMVSGLEISGTDGDDIITVTQDGYGGDVTVTIENESGTTSGTVPAADANGMQIDALAGDDQVSFEPGISYLPDGSDSLTYLGFKVDAGTGNDRVRAGTGRTYVNGSAGNDVIEGGGKDDVIYGGDGDDYVLGNSGNDYIDGGAGDDVLDGSWGNDFIHGGLGNDLLKTGTGNDVAITGDGLDHVWNTGGVDTITAQSEDVDFAVPQDGYNDRRDITLATVPANIHVIDNPVAETGFAERVWADLELYRSTETGQAMLEGLDDGYDVSIRAEYGLNSHAYGPGAEFPTGDPYHPELLAADQTVITYNPSMADSFPVVDPSTGEPARDLTMTPSATLFHEMAHIYDYTHDTVATGTYNGTDTIDANTPNARTGQPGVDNSERVAVGLPTLDSDGNPKTVEEVDPRHPWLLTENAMRTELGIEQRAHYGTGR